VAIHPDRLHRDPRQAGEQIRHLARRAHLDVLAIQELAPAFLLAFIEPSVLQRGFPPLDDDLQGIEIHRVHRERDHQVGDPAGLNTNGVPPGRVSDLGELDQVAARRKFIDHEVAALVGEHAPPTRIHPHGRARQGRTIVAGGQDPHDARHEFAALGSLRLHRHDETPGPQHREVVDLGLVAREGESKAVQADRHAVHFEFPPGARFEDEARPLQDHFHTLERIPRRRVDHAAGDSDHLRFRLLRRSGTLRAGRNQQQQRDNGPRSEICHVRDHPRGPVWFPPPVTLVQIRMTPQNAPRAYWAGSPASEV